MTAGREEVSTSHEAQIPGAVARAGYFLRHFLEMCVVMCVGTGILSVLLTWVGIRRFPELSVLLLAIWLSLLMIAWMRFRRHEWRPTLEMAGTSIVVLPFLIGAAWLGAIPKSGLFGLECGLACALMLAPMLYRLDLYAVRHAGHQHPVHATHMGH